MRPTASNLNFVAGQAVANLVIVKVGAGGKVALYNSSGQTHLVADVMGWYPSGSEYAALAPSRVLDTRAGVGAPKAAVGPGGLVDLQVVGRGGVPASGVGAVVLNVTAVAPTRSGYLTVFPSGQVRPTASNLNFVAGQAVANLVIVKVGAGGKVALYNSSGQTHLVADVMGWYPNTPQSSGALQLVSANSERSSANAQSGFDVAVSADGRYTVFSSLASDLVPGDTNGWSDVFMRDVQTGETSIIDLAPDGSQAPLGAQGAAISPTGRYVAYRSDSSSLVSGDTAKVSDVFVKDLGTGATRRVSVSSTGSQGNEASGNGGLAFSSDERYLAFVSDASNLVAGDTNGQRDVFLHALTTGVTTRVSLSTSGAQGNGPSGLGRIALSHDGRFVTFGSTASNFDPSDSGSGQDVFVRDTVASTTVLASVTSTNAPANSESLLPTLSDDGRYVVFSSLATNLVATDTKGIQNVFRRDLVTHTTELVSVDDMGAPAKVAAGDASVSADGQSVAFVSAATNLVPDPDYAAYSDVLVKNMLSGATVRVSVGANGVAGNQNSGQPAMSADGMHVVFGSVAENLVTQDTNQRSDAFLASLA
ncbi:TolB family protein [Pedococcus bigeumensis]|uniref:TolB family protein n=1 Tax=Pedococcus bigeumensis TaxID=433644 RepID=UPI00112D0208|nr:hypothetical protein [Pedococcus bigeumensis]